VAALLDRPLEDEGRILDALLSGLSAGEPMREWFARLHDAALSQGRVKNLAAAYERIAKEGRTRLLQKPKQAELLLAASRFFGDFASDLDAALAYAERAAQLAPDDAQIFDQLETLLASAQEGGRLAKLYADSAGRSKDPKEELRLLRAAVELFEAYPSNPDDVVRAHRRIIELDPEDRSSFETLERLFASSRRFRDLAELLEQGVVRRGTDATGDDHRFRLIVLYRGELRDPGKAVPHIEALLSRDPIAQEALQAAEALVDNRPSAARVAPLLSDAYRRLGRFEDEASTLALELKLARPPRLAEVHRRLALLRKDVLGDPAGALELLEPLVARDPSDADLRSRYIEVSTTFHREVEAAKLLTRAIASTKDLAVRAAVALDVAHLYAKQGDVRRARAALEPFSDEQGLGDESRLAIATRLVELYQDGTEPKALARALEGVIRREPELSTRIAAARRLAELCQGPVDDPALAVVAWRALIASPRAEEALDRLEALFGATGDDAGLVEVLMQRASRTTDREKARGLAFRAAELRAARAPDRARAIEAFRDVLGGFGPSHDALERLAALLEQQREFRELAATLALLAEHSQPAERPRVLARLGRTRLEELGDPLGALEAIRGALGVDPREPNARRVAEKMLAEGGHRLDALALLEPLYRAEGSHAGVVRILEARAALGSDSTRRLADLDEAYTVAEQHLSEPNRLLDIAGHGLAEAAHGRWAEVPWWLERFRAAALRAGNPARRAELLAEAVRGVAIDRGVAVELIRETAEAQVAAGDVAHAIAAYRSLLAFEPSSPDLLRRIDELLAEQGSPEERVALYRAALSGAGDDARRRELLHTISRIQRRDLGDVTGAVATLSELVRLSPEDLAVHAALVDALESLGDAKGLVAELRRAATLLSGERRAALVLRLSRAEVKLGLGRDALEHYRSILLSDELPSDAFDELTSLAAELDDLDVLSDVLERQVERTTDERERLHALERLGDVQARRDPALAAATFRRAARAARDLEGERPTAIRLNERLVADGPADREAARFLFEAYAAESDFERAERAFTVLVGADGGNDAIDALLAAEDAALAAGAAARLVSMASAATEATSPDALRRRRELMGLSARALASSGATHSGAARAFRDLVETYGEAQDADAFRRFLDRVEPSVVPADERRWLFEWRAGHAVDKAPVFVEWAEAEERLMNDHARAAKAYEAALELDPSHADALNALVRLETRAGRAKVLLGVLESLRGRLAKGEAIEVDLRIAALLVEHLDRPEEALPILHDALARTPDHAEAIRVARAALGARPGNRDFALLLEGSAAAAEGETGKVLLESLLEETRGVDGLADARVRWHERLVDLLSSEPERALARAVVAAEELPAREGLWDAAERLARRVGDPRGVADAYARVLGSPLDPALGEAIGRRIVEFHEEWFDEPATVERLLERVLSISPRARWALDRIKLSYNAEARWDELFGLYDRAIDGAVDDRELDDLLDEAAVAAKDLANEPARAIGYLERLFARKGEPKIESMLERLYERTGRTRQLIALLEKRLGAVAGRELARIERRLAGLYLDLGEAKSGFDYVEKALVVEPDRPEAYELLERLVRLPSTPPPSSSGRKARKRAPRDVRHDAVKLLDTHFRGTSDGAGLARTLEAATELATSRADRITLLDELVMLYLERLDDPERALNHSMTLVRLAPSERGQRERLAALASRLGAEERRGAHLVEVAETADAPTALSLLREAGSVFTEHGKLEHARAAYHRAFAACAGDEKAELDVARALEQVLSDLGLARERCDVLERIVALESDPVTKKNARGVIGQIAFEELADVERSARAYRARVEDDPADLEALDGLERVFDSARRHEELVEVLRARSRLVVPAAARKDRVRIARLQAGELGDPAAAVDTWLAVRVDFGADEESFAALCALFETSARWDELAATVELAAERVRGERRTELFRTLGDLHRDRTAKPIDAVEAYVRAGDFERALTALDVLTDRALAIAVASRLLELCIEAWDDVDDVRGPAVVRAAAVSVETLVRRYLEAGEVERVVETELLAASLPFERAERRRHKRDAAWTSCDRLEQPERAIRILEELFAEDPADEVASASVTRFARLLSEAGRKSELALLWEQQARCRAETPDRVSAALLWARAAAIWETELGNVDRAVAAYRQGAAIGGEASLEALARIYSEQKSWRAAATTLEWLVAQSSREELAVRSLRLADCYLALGQWERAQARLEFAATTAMDASEVRRRLSELYRANGAWAPLAELLVAEAERAADDRSRLALLREAASLHSSERGDPASAVPLLERAVEIDPEEPALRLSLSDALRASGRYDAAAAVLRAQIERYGHRRPKDRALVHLFLARVSLTRGDRSEALTELELGAKINPAHAGILHELGRVALSEGKLARAESTYRALLLVLRKPEGDPGDSPARAEIYLDLSDIAALQGSHERAAELVESAFETALDSPVEAEALELALRKSGRVELLSRAIESRVRTAPEPAIAARALSDLVLLHAERASVGTAEPTAPRIGREAEHIHRDLEARSVHDAGAWEALAQVYEWLGDADGEASALERRVEALLRGEGPLDVEPVLRLARLRLGDPARRDEAVALVERALDAGADSTRAWELLYDPAVTSAGHRGVLRLLERIAREPGRERAFVEIAVLEASAGSLGAAALRDAASLASELGDEASRVAMLEGAAANGAASYTDVERGWLFEELARVLARQRRFPEAAELFESAAELASGKRARALFVEAASVAERELGDLARAARAYETALENDPADRSAWEPLLDVYRKQGDRGRIISLIGATAPLVDSPRDRGRLRLEEATLMLEDPERTDDAVRLLEAIVEEDATMVAAAELLATLFERQGRLGELVELVRNQLERARANADGEGAEGLSLKLGALLERSGDREGGLDVYRSVLDFNGACREALRAVVRLEDVPSREAALADAVERLIAAEEPGRVAPLATRLVALRSSAGDPELLERALVIACAKSPLDGSVREPLVARYVERGEWARAAEVLFRAFEAEPRDLPLLLRAAEAFERGALPERAVEALSAYGDDTDQPELHLERARLFVLLGAPGAAIDAFRAAHSAGARAEELLAALGAAVAASQGDVAADFTLELVGVLESVGETATARERLGALLKEQPRHRDALRKLASISAAEARWDETAATYRRLIPLEEGDSLVGAALNLADACEQSGRLADARGGLERALVSLPDNAELRARLRQIYERTGASRELAELLVREARGQVDRTVRASLLTRAAELLLERNESSKAIAVLEDVRQESPDSVLGAVLYARALASTGRPGEAMGALEEVLAVHRGRRYRELSLVHGEISNIHLEAGDLSKALDALSRAFELDMRNGDLAMQLAHLALDVDDKTTAAKALRAITMMKLRQPGGAEGASAESKAVAYYQMSKMAHAEGDIRKARLMASKAVGENPAHKEAQELLRELKTA
jgi:tetratricopeptide (TPR) repeat protein